MNFLRTTASAAIAMALLAGTTHAQRTERDTENPRTSTPRSQSAEESPRTERTQRNREDSERETNRGTETRNRLRSNRTATQQRNSEDGSYASSGSDLQSAIANCLWIENQAELKLLRDSSRRVQHQQVKKFVSKMISDHEEFGKKLEEFAPTSSTPWAERGRRISSRQSGQNTQDEIQEAVANNESSLTSPETPMGEESAHQESQPQTRTSAFRGPQSSGMSDQMTQMQREIAHECVNLTMEELNQARDEEFDQAFLGTQLCAHISCLAKLNVAAEQVDGEFKQLIEQGQETVRQHKAELNELMEQVASAQGQGTQRESRRRLNQRNNQNE